MFEYLKGLTLGKGTRIALIIFGNFISPYWFLYQFFPHMVKDNNLTQQIIFSLAVAIPITCINAAVFIVEYFEEDNLKRKHVPDEDFYQSFVNLITFCSVFTAISLYLPCILSFFISIKGKNSIYYVFFGEFLPAFYVYKQWQEFKKKFKKEVSANLC